MILFFHSFPKVSVEIICRFCLQFRSSEYERDSMELRGVAPTTFKISGREGA